MNDDIKTTRINLDGFHILEISVNEKSKTVVADMIEGKEKTFIYAEKFDSPCNYLRTAIKKCLIYLNGDEGEAKYIRKNYICLNSDGNVI